MSSFCDLFYYYSIDFDSLESFSRMKTNKYTVDEYSTLLFLNICKHKQVLPDRIPTNPLNCSIYLLVCTLEMTLESRNRSNGSKTNHKMKTLIVAFMLLFNYLDTLPKL